MKKKKNIDTLDNSLGQAIGFPEMPFGSPIADSEQTSDPMTMFKNLRWYLLSNFRQVLSQLYVEIGLVKTLVDVPVDDAFQGELKFTSKQLSNEDIDKLKHCMNRNDDITTIKTAIKWNRLYGGAGIVLITDQDPHSPFDIKSLHENSPLEFRAVDMWELFWDKQNSEGYDPAIQAQDFEFYNYYAENIHRSRVMRLKGLVAPSFLRPRLRGWGVSVVETLVRSINQYLKATDLTFEVLDEFKLDIFKIKNLTNILFSPDGTKKVQQRVQMANWQKNYQHALVMDSEDDYDHKQLSFAGLSETIQGIRMQVASDMRFPMVKLFGTPATGLNADDEGSIKVYNSMVEAEIRNKSKYDILRIAEIRCQMLFGFVPTDLLIEFPSLIPLSSEQEETVKTQKFTRLSTALSTNAISINEFRLACNKDKLLPIDLVVIEEEAHDDQPGTDEVESGSVEIGVDTDDPGASRADTRKPRLSEQK